MRRASVTPRLPFANTLLQLANHSSRDSVIISSAPPTPRRQNPVSTTPLRLMLAAGIGLVLAQGAWATDEGAGPNGGCDAPSRDCVAVGHWNFDVSLGAGLRTDPVVYEAAIPLVVIPHVSYYGKRLFVEDLDFGIT